MAYSGIEYDVVIVGGGISGLYTAWRLGTSTNLRVLLLEGSDRFGGRFLTCQMPGGFDADLAAMRYLPPCHKILHKLTEVLGVKTEIRKNAASKSNNKFNFFLRNQRLQGLDDLRKLYSISEIDLPVFLAIHKILFTHLQNRFDLDMPADGSYSKAKVGNTGHTAETMTVRGYQLLTNNSEVANFGENFYPPPNFRVDAIAAELGLLEPHWHSLCKVIGGMEEIVKALVEALSFITTVDLWSSSKVLSIAEYVRGFSIATKGLSFQASQVILSCGKAGLANMLIKSAHERQQVLNQLTSTHGTVRGFKTYFTYEKAWWEEYGFFEGSLATDLPLTKIFAFGEHGKTDSHATLLAAYTFENVELFEGLDQPMDKRFVNQEGDVREELVPSQKLVDYVQDQLRIIFGCPDLPAEPVCAVRMIWGTETTDGVSNYPKMGVDSNQVHWDSLKPFDDANFYITGDVFPAWDINGCYIGFSETGLLTSERILVNHFHLKPLTDGLSLHNQWPAHSQLPRSRL